MRRWIIVLAAIGMVTSACGGSTSSAATTPTASSVAIADVVTDPGMPEVLLLMAPSGTPESIDRICVEVSSEPNVIDAVEVTRRISRGLELLDIEVVDIDCRAVLSVEAIGRRQSANYAISFPSKECWTGWSYRVTAELSIDSMVQERWMERDSEAPPNSISSGGCTKKDATVLKRLSFLEPVFGDMWGDLGLGALWASTGGHIPDDLEFTEEVLQLIAHHLLTEPTDGTPNGDPLWQLRYSTDTLMPLVPYLIAVMERHPSRHGAVGESIDLALQRITDSRYSKSYDEWWLWWTLHLTCLQAGGHLTGITETGEGTCSSAERSWRVTPSGAEG
jgi:hypothetical protein